MRSEEDNERSPPPLKWKEGVDFYRDLGLPFGASTEEAKQAHRRLIRDTHEDVVVGRFRKRHPNGTPEDEEAAREAAKRRAQVLNNAYEVLGKRPPEWKKNYDAWFAKEPLPSPSNAPPSGPSGPDDPPQGPPRKQRPKSPPPGSSGGDKPPRRAPRPPMGVPKKSPKSEQPPKPASAPPPPDPEDIEEDWEQSSDKEPKHRKEALRKKAPGKGITLIQLIYGCSGSGCLILLLLLFILPRACRNNESFKEELTVWTDSAMERVLVADRLERLPFYLKEANVLDPRRMSVEQFADFIHGLFLDWRRSEWTNDGPRCAHMGEMRHNEEHYLAWAVVLNQASFQRLGDFGTRLDLVISHLEKRAASVPAWQLKSLRDETLPLLHRIAILWEELPLDERQALYSLHKRWRPDRSKAPEVSPLFRRHEIDPARVQETFAEH